jgi:hypothetical protein
MEKLLDGHLLIAGVDVRIGLAEQVVGQEGIDGLGLLRRRERRVALLGDFPILSVMLSSA